MREERVAIVHEWLDARGGSEQVFYDMARTFPGADLWALWNSGGMHDLSIRESWLASTALRGRKALALPFMAFTWRRLSTTAQYDVVVSSSHCFAHRVRFPASSAVYLSYVYTPMRYLWSPQLDSRRVPLLSSLSRGVFRFIDRQYLDQVASFAAISHEVRRRIARFWHRNARVIYPPVDTDFFVYTETSRPLPFSQYALAVGRFISYKRFDLAIAAASAARSPLVIAGAGADEPRLRKLAERSDMPVSFEIAPTRARLRELYSGADALIFPVHEDFGIVPLEALACGTPVVGLARGGLLETIEHGVTGWLVEQESPMDLAHGLRRAADLPRATLREHALPFGRSRFRDEFRRWVTDAIVDH